MAVLLRTQQAENDLLQIWNYTADKWGVIKADQYLDKIDRCFNNIKSGKAKLKNLTEKIKYIKCEHHFIFLLVGKNPIVIAILHEKMDLISRIKNRIN